jgi:siroheme synthase
VQDPSRLVNDKGAKALAANVVLYDALANEELLSYAPSVLKILLKDARLYARPTN